MAAGLATLGERPDGDGRVWHLPTAPAVSTREIHALIERRVGRPRNVVVLPEARPFGPFDERYMGEYAQMFYQHTEPQIMDSSAFARAFGAAPTPLTGTIGTTLAWYGRWLANR